MKQAVIITGKYIQDVEFVFSYYRFQEASFNVISASEDGKETFGVNGVKIPVDTMFDDLKVKDYEILIIPGGARAMEYIRQNQKVLDFISEFNKSNKLIGCICHGTQLLISAKVVKGRKISGYYSIKDDINNAGAIYIDAPVVVDKNIITSPHYKYMGEWMKEIMKQIKK